MTDLQSLLLALEHRLDADESLEVEFKKARGGLPKDLWPTISAFANTRGGWIILGVGETEAGPEATGIDDPDALLKLFFDGLRNPQKISHPVCGADDASIEPVAGRVVIVLRVPAAARKACPVYVNGNPYEGTYVRRHSGDYRCTKPEVDRMMREASDSTSDGTILPYLDWDDLDRETFRRYRQRFQVRNPADHRNAYDDDRFLRAIDGFARDKERQLTGITVAGLLMFGTDEAIRRWRGRHLIDFRLLPSNDEGDRRWDDRIPWEGNLLGAFESIYPELTRGLPTPFRLEGGVRVGEGPAQEALREALVNLLVHADYAETQASLIARQPDGFLFRNPGASRIPEFELLTRDRSDPRNPTLVRMFRFLGLAEEAGTGMPKIVQAWRQLGFMVPDIDPGTERYEFRLRLRHAHLIADADREWLTRLGGSWSEAEQIALVMARHDGEVDNREVQLRTGLHSADVSGMLRRLRSRGLLERVDDARWPPAYGLGDVATAALDEPDAGSAVQRGHSGISGESSGDSSSSSGIPGAGSGDSEALPGAEARPSGDVQAELERIAAPVRGRAYVSQEELERATIALCQVAPLSAREAAEVVQKSPEHVAKLMRGLRARGVLEYLYPERPRHPQQRYVART